MKKISLLCFLMFAGVASAQQKGVSLGGTHSNLDLFKVYFSWGQIGAPGPPLSLTLQNATQLYIPVNGSAVIPALLIGSSPVISAGLEFTSGGLFFNSSGSQSTASLSWTPNTLSLANNVLGSSATFFSSVTLSPSVSSATYSSTAGSGSDAFSVTTNGARFHFGTGASDYASSNGTTVTFAGPLAATAASAAIAFTVPIQSYISFDPTNNNSFIRSPGSGQVEFSTTQVVPAGTSAIDLGSSTKVWNNVYFTTLRPTTTAGLIFSTAPTISSGFGVGAAIVASNGTGAFQINVGTGGTANSGVIGLPTATTGWVCKCDDITTQTATVTRTTQTASTTASCTVVNYSDLTVLSAWVASDKLNCVAMAY